MNRRRTTTQPWISVLYSPGTNCEVETVEAIRLAGGDPHLIFLWDIYNKKVRITDCDELIVPGGFSYGDHIETGVATAILLEHFWPAIIEAKIPMLGICNGNQILVRTGLIGPGIAMIQNKSKVFCSRPIRHLVLPSKCIWTRGLEGEILRFPSAHGYGRLVVRGKINVVMEYEGVSPNGGKVAMITNDSGLIGVLMNHPERPYGNPDGLKIFQNGVRFVK
jgi:phosphoribosylformylglycinamidine (FGAM) synthase-like amidotransferase family enzyme